jgi:hypothetical protein
MSGAPLGTGAGPGSATVCGLDGGQELTRRAQVCWGQPRQDPGDPDPARRRPDDGQVDIAVLTTRTLGDWVGVAARILVRSRKPGPDVDTFRADKVEICCDRASRCSSTATRSTRPTGSTLRSTLGPAPWPSPNTTRTRPPQSDRTRTEHRHRHPGNPPTGWKGRGAWHPAFDRAEEQAFLAPAPLEPPWPSRGRPSYSLLHVDLNSPALVALSR